MSEAISNKLCKSHFRYIYFRMKMLVQSKLRSTFVRVFLLRVSPKTLPLPFCLLPVKNVRLFHLRNLFSLILKNISTEIQNFGNIRLLCNQKIYMTKKYILSHQQIIIRGVIPYKLNALPRWDSWPALSQRRRWWARDRSWQLDEALVHLFENHIFLPFF